ncbi:MAG: Planctomycete cytochrome [Verrucomicrobiaceae bacterium]|nr:Planctomycete cytochrome [Verrucomicrobiaceae bacterium]
MYFILHSIWRTMTGIPHFSAFVLLGTLAAQAAAPPPEALKFFENQVRPLLVKQCQECHGPQKHKGGLRLDNLTYILQGGETGPAVVPGDAEKSLLIKAVEYGDKDLQMPPDEKMKPEEIAALKQWIAMGAPWPEAEVAGARTLRKPGQITAEDRKWWAFQKVVEPKVPEVKKTGSGLAAAPLRNPIDNFVRAKLSESGLKPSLEASPVELVRRVTLDLTGLPPTPERVAQYVADCAAEAHAKPARPAYERLVDELLASPRYGERSAQHWLDLVRYAESDGYRLDSYRPNAWPYRDYVIKAMNDDKPYGQFVREQLAGDEIAPEDPNVLVATGYLRHTIYGYNERDAEGQWGNILNEVTDVTADVFLGLSVQCAHCHDHKFDPILQKDYYRLQAFFGNMTWAEDKVLATPEEKRRYDEQLKAYKEATKEPQKIIDAIIEPRIAKAQAHAMSIFPDEVKAMYDKPKEQRTPWEEQVVQLAWRQAEYERVRFKEEKLKEAEATALAKAREELVKFESLKPKPLLTALAVGETGTTGATMTYKTRKAGEVKTGPGFLTILDPDEAKIPEPSGNATTTGRRTVLANWMTDPTNPITWRVIVNRVWQHHFGRGITGTPSDLGHLGEKPTQPELLDWLTSQFIKGGGKMKDLHRLIVTSATYRQESRIEPQDEAAASPMLKDPEDRLLWRFPPQRLDAEQARDSALAASGELMEREAGEGEAPASPCRAIYTKKLRNTPDAFLASLDQPAGFQSIPERQATTTATQSLLMINGDWPLERARAMALRLTKSKPADDASLVRTAYSLAYARDPRPDETKAATSFLKTQRAQLKREAPPPPPAASPLAAADKFFGHAAPAGTQKTLMLQPGTPNEKLRVNTGGKIEPEKFCVEAVVWLNSLHPDATVRTIVSRWNNKKDERGWSLGVTGLKSGFKPNNLIMQLSGEDFQGSPSYEAVASGIRIETGKPYYVAASVDIEPGPGQQFGGNVTFYVRDLSDSAAPMQSVTVADQIPGEYVNEERALYVGGRDQDKRSIWDGAIAHVSLRSGALDPGKLMSWTGKIDPLCIADISGDEAQNMLKAPAAQRWAWETSVPPVKGAPKGPFDPNTQAITDLCHALINSNEFFYLQ